VIPLIYARQGSALYVLTTEGRKVRSMRKNPVVCFEVDEYDPVTGSWQSVLVQGRYEEVDEPGRADALTILSRRHGSRRASSDAPGTALPTVAFRICIESATGRAVRRGPESRNS
jgi:nitroimidazol reductase NimA-like FMN-containing flavoprotein (pyridoxamine 5'-phosphate oxidase superfamily)